MFVFGFFTGVSLMGLLVLWVGTRTGKKPHVWKAGDHARVCSLDNASAGSHMSTISFHGQEIVIHDFIDGNAIAMFNGNWLTIPLELLEPVQAGQAIPAKG